MKERERDVEKRLVDQVKKLGGIAYKLTSPGNVGVPDRLVLLPRGIIYFVELKTDSGRMSPVQKFQQARIRRLGCRVETVYGMAGVDKLTDEMKRRVDLVAPTGEEVTPHEVRAARVPGPHDPDRDREAQGRTLSGHGSGENRNCADRDQVSPL